MWGTMTTLGSIARNKVRIQPVIDSINSQKHSFLIEICSNVLSESIQLTQTRDFMSYFHFPTRKVRVRMSLFRAMFSHLTPCCCSVTIPLELDYFSEKYNFSEKYKFCHIVRLAWRRLIWRLTATTF